MSEYDGIRSEQIPGFSLEGFQVILERVYLFADLVDFRIEAFRWSWQTVVL